MPYDRHLATGSARTIGGRVSTMLCLVLLLGLAAPGGAWAQRERPNPEGLWEAYPLDPSARHSEGTGRSTQDGITATPIRQRKPAVGSRRQAPPAGSQPARGDGSGASPQLVVAVLLAATLLGVLTLTLVQRSRRAAKAEGAAPAATPDAPASTAAATAASAPAAPAPSASAVRAPPAAAPAAEPPARRRFSPRRLPRRPDSAPSVMKCWITLREEDGLLRFWAVGSAPDGRAWTYGASPPFAASPAHPLEQTGDAVVAHARLVTELTDAGWQPSGKGLAWYAQRFSWASLDQTAVPPQPTDETTGDRSRG